MYRFLNIITSLLSQPTGPGLAQYYKDAWEGTDLATLPGKCTDTQDYANCWSGTFVSACGLPYDYKSVMHYYARA